MSNGQRALSPWKRLENIVRRAIFKTKPGIGIYDMPVYARVLKARFAGGKVNGRSKGFSVDAQVMTTGLIDDSAWAPITDVPIDPETFGEGGAIYTVPKKGAIVRLAFMYHNPAFPFIMAITAEGQELPEGTADEFRVEIGDIIFQVTKDTLKFKTKNYNTDIEILVDAILEHLHTGNTGSPTSNTQGAVPPTLPAAFKQGGL